VSNPTQTDVTPTEGGEPVAGPAAPRFETKGSVSDHFAWLRTSLAVERTLMAWLRTAVSLIGFGFAIVQFFDRMSQMPGTKPARFPDAPRYLGLALILCGVLALLVSIWQYEWARRYLWSETFTSIAGVTEKRKQTPTVAVAVVLILIGIFAFLAVLGRLV
jgi:putative membrane protein